MKTRIEMKMLRLVREAVKKWELFDNGERVLLVVSGSKESLALLQVLQEYSLQIEILYISLYPEKGTYYGDFCRKYGSYHTLNPELAEEYEKSSKKDYYLKKVITREILKFAENNNFSKIITAMNREHFTRKILSKLLFGTNDVALKAIESSFNGKYIWVHPFFLVPSATINEYCDEKKIKNMEGWQEIAAGKYEDEAQKLLYELSRKFPEQNIADNIISRFIEIQEK